MKLTKSQLKQIIKEELEAVVETAQLEGGPEVDIQDAIQMLEAEESRQEGWPGDYQTGQLYYVINRLHEALAKLRGDPDQSTGTPKSPEELRDFLDGIAESIELMSEEEFAAANGARAFLRIGQVLADADPSMTADDPRYSY
jgi:hypothetical protein